METLFWLSVLGVVYAYFGYPLLLRLLPARPLARAETELPSVTVLIPMHNEAAVIEGKLRNTLSLDYPRERLEILVVSDGSTDEGPAIVRRLQVEGPLRLLEVAERKGKANALNTGLLEARGDIVVFSDASIMLEEAALRNVVGPFADPTVGCVSGEDLIAESGGEGLYGRYELFLRNQESRVHSIVGASGCFYAQRRSLCEPFPEGLAPDFLSVLNTVEQGYRAVTEPTARGNMVSVKSHRSEFQRKVRTFLRGMSALFAKPGLMNPGRTGVFAVLLISHKLVRWLVPVFMLLALLSNLALAGEPFYLLLLALQLAFYAAAALALAGPLRATLIGKIALYFTIVNAAILVAWGKFLRGVRQEVWDPSKRAA